VLATINPEVRKSDKYGFEYMEDFREPKLKLNDDKKINITLSRMKKDGLMILLTVRCDDLRGNPPKDGEFDRAWFRIINEETNQTVDYKKIKEIEKPDEFDEDAPVEEDPDEEEPKPRTEVIYVAGRLFLQPNGRWVYESYNHCFTTDKHPDLASSLSEIYKRSEEEYASQNEAIKNAKDKLLANEEERKQAAKTAAQKKKGKGAGKKDSKEEAEEKLEEVA